MGREERGLARSLFGCDGAAPHLEREAIEKRFKPIWEHLSSLFLCHNDIGDGRENES
jgi:hypothetical protein